MLLSVMLLVILNLVFFVVVFVRNTSSFNPPGIAVQGREQVIFFCRQGDMLLMFNDLRPGKINLAAP